MRSAIDQSTAKQVATFAKQLFLLGRDAVDFRADLVQPPAVKFLQVAECVVVAQRRVEHAEGIGRVDRQRVAVIKLDHLLGQREEGLDDAQQMRWGGAQVGDMGGVELGEALPDQRCGLPAIVDGSELFTLDEARDCVCVGAPHHPTAHAGAGMGRTLWSRSHRILPGRFWR